MKGQYAGPKPFITQALIVRAFNRPAPLIDGALDIGPFGHGPGPWRLLIAKAQGGFMSGSGHPFLGRDSNCLFAKFWEIVWSAKLILGDNLRCWILAILECRAMGNLVLNQSCSGVGVPSKRDGGCGGKTQPTGPKSAPLVFRQGSRQFGDLSLSTHNACDAM